MLCKRQCRPSCVFYRKGECIINEVIRSIVRSKEDEVKLPV